MNGKRIVITRPPEQAQHFAEQLKALGAIPIVMPTITIQPPADRQPLDHALSQHYDWVIFTSANAVHAVCQQSAVCWSAIAVIGPATAKALSEYGLTPTLIAERHVAEGVFEILAAHTDLRGKRILLPQANLARPVLVQLLQATGAQIDVVTAYETVRPVIDPNLLAQPFDAITFTSSSTVQNFVDLFDNPLSIIGDARIVCIGPVTADTARDLGLPVHAVADPHTMEGLMNVLHILFERKTTV
jgi:uroporphyrinogen III methyltransferase/synthase